MHRKFITNLGLLLFLNILIKPFWVFIDLTVQNAVATSEYGFYSQILNLTFTFNILLDIGITNFNNRNIAQHNQLLNKHFSNIILLKVLLGMLFLLVMLVSAIILHYEPRQYYFLAFLAINQFLVSFILYLRSNISGLLHFKTDSFISILDRMLMIVFCGILLWGGITQQPFKIVWFVYVQTFAYLLTAFIAFIIVAKKSSFNRLQWNPLFFRMIVRQSYPYAILVLLMTFYNRFDSVMLGEILEKDLGNEQVGIYASAFRLLDAVNMIAYLTAVILMPMFARLIKQNESVQSLVKLSFTLLFTLSVIVSVTSFFYSSQIMDALYVKHQQQSAAVFRFLILGFIPISTTYVFGTLLTANGSLKTLNIIAFSGMVMNIVLNLVFIPRYFAEGSAFASLITQTLTALLQLFMAYRIFNFSPKPAYLLSLLVFALGVVLLSRGSLLLPFDWKVSYLLVGTCSLLLAFVTRLIKLKAIVGLLKKAE